VKTEYLEIAGRFCGPPNSGNGGYVCGVLAKHLTGTVTVRLKAPPPLRTKLRREWTNDSARLFHDSVVIGEARTSELRLELPNCPTFAQAEQAAAAFPGFKSHLFPGCFVCGPAREDGDGLRIFSGPVRGKTLHAAPWVPHESLADDRGDVATEFIWAALDCPSGFAVLPVPEGLAIVLGELCASIESALVVGQPAVVTSWPIAHEGRRRTAGTAIPTTAGQLIATACAVWIEVQHSQWAPSN
jgi:hypothetical protein